MTKKQSVKKENGLDDKPDSLPKLVTYEEVKI
jgi:hypothetical protein